MAKRKKSSPVLYVSVFAIGLILLGIYFSFRKNNVEINQLNEKQSIPVVTPTVTESPKKIESVPPIETTRVQMKDTTPPKAYILSPEDRVHVHAPVKIVANVTDDVQVERVEFYAGSSDYQLIAIVKQAPFEATWIPAAGFSGYGNKNNIPVYIKAYDSSGNYGGSSISVYLEQ